MRGEKTCHNKEKDGETGSPPLARGKEVQAEEAFEIVGITPACAGKSSSEFAFSESEGDHPRLRGEKASGTNLLKSLPGSPPLARGKGLPIVPEVVSLRITPACAGKSC